MDKLTFPILGDMHGPGPKHPGAFDLSNLLSQKASAGSVWIGSPPDAVGPAVNEQAMSVLVHTSQSLFKKHDLVGPVAFARTGQADALAQVHATLDAGLFNTNLAGIPAMQLVGLTASDVLDSQGPLFDAFFGAYGEARFTKVKGEPGMPVFPVPILVTLPHGVPAFEPVLEKVFDALVKVDQAMQDQGLALTVGTRTELFAKALATACTMGMPEAIGPLAARCPDAMREPLWIGDGSSGTWSQHMSFGKTYLATPAFFAVQYGHPECLDALRAAGLERQFCLTHSRNPGREELTPIAHHEFFSSFSLAILPSQLPAMLERMDHKVVANNPGMKAIASSDPMSPPKTQRTFLPVFMAEGTFDKIPVAEVLKAACMGDAPEAIDFFVDKAPWAEMNSMLVTDVAIRSGGRAAEGALVALLKVAHEQGHTQMFAPYESSDLRQADPTNQFQPQEDYEVSVTEPAYSVIRAGMRETLVLLMKNGLQPDEKDDFGTSPLDAARETRMPDMDHVMRTFLARNAVLGILDEIDAPEAGANPKKNTKPSP